LALFDVHDKSRNVAVPSSIPMQEGRFSVRPGTFVVGVLFCTLAIREFAVLRPPAEPAAGPGPLRGVRSTLIRRWLQSEKLPAHRDGISPMRERIEAGQPLYDGSVAGWSLESSQAWPSHPGFAISSS
jgi:hypothetical protein